MSARTLGIARRFLASTGGDLPVSNGSVVLCAKIAYTDTEERQRLKSLGFEYDRSWQHWQIWCGAENLEATVAAFTARGYAVSEIPSFAAPTIGLPRNYISPEQQLQTRVS